jgi:microcystin-dependent protein
MARTEIPVVVTDPVTGKAVQGATVQINRRSDGTAAAVFAAETGSGTVGNPRTSDANGDVVGWLDRGSYVAVITAAGYATKTVNFESVPGADQGIDSAALAPGAGVPTGLLLPWPYREADIPVGYLAAAGQAVSRTTYATLHGLAAASGYPHGSGDGATTFNLPDTRGRVMGGKDDTGGAAAGRLTSVGSGVAGTTLGATGGAESVALSTAQMPAHAHGMTGGPTLSGAPGMTGAPTYSDGGHAHSQSHSAGNTSAGTGGASAPDTSGANTGITATGITLFIGSLAATVGSLAVAAGSLAVASVGGGGAHSSVQPTLVVNHIIKT